MNYVRALKLPDVKPLLGSTPIFRDDKKMFPLQAADLLAWHLRREAEKNETLPVLDALRTSGRHPIIRIDESTLEAMADKLSRIPGLVRGKRAWRKFKSYGPLTIGKRLPTMIDDVTGDEVASVMAAFWADASATRSFGIPAQTPRPFRLRQAPERSS